MSVSQPEEQIERADGASIAVIGLFILALIAALYLASDILVPIVFAIFVKVLLSPIVRALGRRGIAPGISAAFLVCSIIAAVVVAVSTLSGPAEQWLQDAPRTVRELQDKIAIQDSQLSNIQELADEVEELTATDAPDQPPPVVVARPSVIENLVGGFPSLAATAGILIFLIYFLLASGDRFFRQMTKCGRTWSERRRIVSVARKIQIDISRYLATVTVINILLGVVVSLTMSSLGVPNAILWGAMVAMFNFAPYIGAMASLGILTIVGLMSFEEIGDALLVPGLFFVLTVLEGQLITPSILGRRMSLSPIVVFLAVIFWGWLWGILGALMAVPIVTSFAVLCEHTPRMKPLVDFLRHDRMRYRRRMTNSTNQSLAVEPIRDR